MFNKKINIVLFLLAVIIQLSVITYISINSEQILNNGLTIKMKLEPIDPVDPFRGHYIYLNFDSTITTVNIENNDKRWFNQRYFAIMEQDSDGFYKVKSVSKKEPSNNKVYFKTFAVRFGGSDSTKYTLHIPFNRFYMEEKKAKEIDKIMQNANRDSLNTYIIIKYKEGELLVKDLVVEKIK